MSIKPTSPTEEDIETFERDGVVCLRNALDTEFIAVLKEGIDEIVASITNSSTGYDVTQVVSDIFETRQNDLHYGNATQYDLNGLAALLRGVNAKPLKDRIIRKSRAKGRFLLDTSTWLRSRGIRRIALDSVLPEIAARLLRSHKINYCDDQVFVKEPGTEERTAFHQDYTYFNLQGKSGCVMWICVDACDQEAGGLSYVRGSHLWRKEFKPNVFIAQTAFPGSTGEQLPDIEANLGDYDIVRFATKPGDVIIHHFLTVHGAGGNRTEHSRRAVSLRYSGDDVRFHLRPGTPAQPHHHHELSEGDLLDSAQFPVVFPKPFPGFELGPLYDQSAHSAQYQTFSHESGGYRSV